MSLISIKVVMVVLGNITSDDDIPLSYSQEGMYYGKNNQHKM